MNNATQIILAVISGGVLQAIFTFFISMKKEKRADFETMYKILIQENERLRKNVDELTEKVNSLTFQMNQLQHKKEILEAKQLEG